MSEAALDFRGYDFFRKLTELPFVDVIFLYGSHARGSADARSDIDLAILCPDATPAQWQQVRGIVENADILLKVDVTRWDRIPADEPFRKQIDRERVPLFIREDKSQAELLENTLALMHWHLKVARDAMAKIYDSAEERQRDLAKHFHKALRYFYSLARRALLLHGMRRHTPLSILKSAYMQGWLQDRALWERMFAEGRRIALREPELLALLEHELPAYLEAMERAAAAIRKEVSPEALTLKEH